MTITERGITYDIPEIVLSLLRTVVGQAEGIHQSIDVAAWYDSLDDNLKAKIKVTKLKGTMLPNYTEPIVSGKQRDY